MTLGPGGRRIWHTVEVDEEIAVRGDPLLLRLALRTALQNSIEASGRVHSGRNLQIRVQAQADQQRVWIRVEDTGPGFPEAVLQAFANGRLADLRSVSAARVRGIGLALLEQIALLHEGGKLTLGNREGNTGAWVQLDLPRWNEDTPPANRATLDEPIPRL